MSLRIPAIDVILFPFLYCFLIFVGVLYLGRPFPRKAFGIFGLLVLVGIPLLTWPTYMGGLQTDGRSRMLQISHTIALAMFQYSVDHSEYPSGRSSTEAFQKLLDGGYITDPTIFYLPIAGKTKLEDGKMLRPENVCWDVTSPVDNSSPDELPLVFPTGYKVDYAPSGAAIPVVKPYPIYTVTKSRTSWQWLHGWPPPITITGAVVCYKDTYATYLEVKMSADGTYSIPDFVPASFDAVGRTYRQLTPDGVLGN